MKNSDTEITEIFLSPENPQKDPGVVRIEQVRICRDTDEEIDDSAGFEFAYHEDDEESAALMFEAVAKKYGVSKDIISIEQ